MAFLWMLAESFALGIAAKLGELLAEYLINRISQALNDETED